MYRTNVINQVFKSQIFIKNDVRDIRQILLSVCSLCRSKWTMVWLWISVKLSFSLHHGRCLQTAYRVMEVKQRVSHMDCRALIGWSAHYFHVKCFHRPLALTMFRSCYDLHSESLKPLRMYLHSLLLIWRPFNQQNHRCLRLIPGRFVCLCHVWNGNLLSSFC